MAAVKHTKFHKFVWLDIVNQNRTGFFPGGPAIGEIILDNPLRKGFGFNRSRIVHSGQTFGIFKRASCRRWRNPVNHRRGEGNLFLNPTCQVRVDTRGKVNHTVAQQHSVRWQIITGNDCKRSNAGLFAALQPGNQYPEKPGWRVGICQIMFYGRMFRLNPSRHPINAICLFGNRDGHDPDCRIGKRVQNRCNITRSRNCL